MTIRTLTMIIRTLLMISHTLIMTIRTLLMTIRTRQEKRQDDGQHRPGCGELCAEVIVSLRPEQTASVRSDRRAHRVPETRRAAPEYLALVSTTLYDAYPQACRMVRVCVCVCVCVAVRHSVLREYGAVQW